MTRTIEIETPSGKGAGDENFPVGSFLIAKDLRPHVAAYYDFARAIDDIADNPDAPAKQKIAGLKAM
ncbi:MAG TPA: squalene synthase HpnC, partial [Rhizobiales bacterium]|nr:squalene synthase HpnC [Hyphomicrobiales bacterium]